MKRHLLTLAIAASLLPLAAQAVTSCLWSA
jgi:hypothetical protein